MKQKATLYAREIIIGFFFILFFNNKIFCTAALVIPTHLLYFYSLQYLLYLYVYCIYLNMLYILQSSVIVHSAECTTYFVEIPIILLQYLITPTKIALICVLCINSEHNFKLI